MSETVLTPAHKPARKRANKKTTSRVTATSEQPGSALTEEDNLLPTGAELAAQAQQQAAQAQQQAVQERQRAELLAAKLRELGIDPETL